MINLSKTVENFVMMVYMGLFIGSATGHSRVESGYATVTWVNGTYPHAIVEMFITYNLQYPTYFEIPTGYPSQSILLLRGISIRHRLSYWIAVLSSDKKIFIHELIFTQGTEHYPNALIDLNRKINLHEDMFLEVRIMSDKSMLQYRWIDEGIMTISRHNTVVINDEDLIKAGLPMQDFRVKMLNGEFMDYFDLLGNIVVLNWWGTWCKPCVTEIPGLNRLVRNYGHNSQIIFIAIATDSEALLKKFLLKQRFDYRQAVHNPSVDALFGSAFPRNIIVDSGGMVVFDQVGGSENSYETIGEILEEIVERKE